MCWGRTGTAPSTLRNLTIKAGIAFAVAAFAALSTDPDSAPARPAQKFTVIDRTMVCTTAFEGGVPDRIRTMSVSVNREEVVFGGQGAAGFALSTGRTALVSVTTGDTSVDTPGGRRRSSAHVLVNRRRCTRIKSQLPLVREERSASPVVSRAGCKLLDAPPRIIVRLRAVMQSRVGWSVEGPYLRARGAALEGFLAVRAHPARKPIAFASLDRAGAARFFRAPRCTE